MNPLLLALVLAQPPSPSRAVEPPPAACGSERWLVKTLSDDKAANVKTMFPQASTIAAINALEAHCDAEFEHAHEKTRVPLEFEVFEVLGRLTHDPIHEKDSDFHIPAADPNAPAETMIFEIPHPGCAEHSPLLAILKAVRAKALDAHLKKGMLIRVRGVAFYDLDHRQTGRSRSCLELHPVIDLEVVKEP